ncbi:ADP,ATP carrier protein, mitochondrial-like [Salvia miltiorrhiza]|uniref:ADP,ATP carrier protein, mitochondrial-like n=1 Tax=Salvia miltiorrhiza TaxID=226208 RepID=UPI0025ACD689|nr:ADP,ATP carrier protein, mitochondrial-like [Salvia miltiorrhiza]
MDETQHSGGNTALAYPSVVKYDGFVQDKRFVGLSFLTGVAVCKTATAPIDRVKLLMQNEGAIAMAGRLSGPYKGIRDCLWRTIREEGVASLWRGNTVNVIRYLPSQALTLGSWDCFRSVTTMLYQNYEFGYLRWCCYNFGAGAFAGSTFSFFFQPMDYVRTRLAMDVKKGGTRQFKGALDLCKKTLAADGVAGFYRGFTHSYIGATVYRGIYFGMYESLKPVVLTGEMQDSFFGRFGVAWVSAIVAGSASYTFDISRRGMMMMMCGEFKSAFKGGGANMPRAIVGAAALAAYDMSNPFNLPFRALCTIKP